MSSVVYLLPCEGRWRSSKRAIVGAIPSVILQTVVLASKCALVMLNVPLILRKELLVVTRFGLLVVR